MMHYAIVFAFAFTVLCRATHMDANTPGRVRWQHRIALLLAALSLPVFSGYGDTSFLLLGLSGCALLWFERRGSPRDSPTKMIEIAIDSLRNVSGGRK